MLLDLIHLLMQTFVVMRVMCLHIYIDFKNLCLQFTLINFTQYDCNLGSF